LKKRPDLKLIVSSATADASSFQNFFGNPSTVITSVPGRQFPLSLFYKLSPVDNYVSESIETVFQIHTTEPLGDVLVFLPTKNQVDKAVKEINSRGKEYTCLT
jgi:HrpA-like RNA helicase